MSNFPDASGNKINIIYCGCASGFAPVDKEKASTYVEKRYGIAGDYLLYVGNMNPHKNLPMLIKALKVCLTEGIKLKLVICGRKGVLYSQLKNVVEQFNLSGSVYFIDDADDQQEVMLYSAARIFVFLSLYEGFGMPPVEAMACGTPVVSSDRSSLREVLGKSALFVDPENMEQITGAIKGILQDGDLFRELQKKGLLHRRRYAWNDSARQLLKSYQDLCYEVEHQRKTAAVPQKEAKEHVAFSPEPKVSVIIPSYDGFREGSLPRLMEDLGRQSFRDFEIHVIKRVSPQGKAINLGAQRAKGDILVILDDDSQLGTPEVLKNLVAVLENDKSIGMAGASILVPPDANWLQRQAGKEFPRFGMRVVDKVTESDMACHGCCAIPKKVFEEVGRERENILRGLDPDLRFRMRQKGYKTVLVSDTWVYHPLPGTAGKLIKTFFRNGMGSAYCLKYQPELIYDTDETLEMRSFRPRIPFVLRIFRFPVRIITALVEFKFLRFLAYSIYAAGFYYGIIKYSLTGKGEK